MLTQTEAECLIAMEKRFENPCAITIGPGADSTYDLVGDDSRERFLLDLWRGTLRLSKLKLQARGRRIVVLVRVDIDGAPHTNPDGERVGRTHIHRYREGYDDKWAEPLDVGEFSDPSNIAKAYEGFCGVCNIVVEPQQFQPELL